jgi:predicted GNAT superfamily acetyltransferase
MTDKNWYLKILDTPAEMAEVERLQHAIWEGSELDVVPAHMLMAIAHNGGLIIGAIVAEQLVGFVVGFPGLEAEPDGWHLKHTSHELGVHPAYRGQGLGFALKRAQWQMVRHQNIDLITWTYDPLQSRNAHLNLARLGGICNKYQRDFYGPLRDGLNFGLPSDRFVIDWWLNSPRVESRLSRRARRRLDLAHYLSADIRIINPSQLDPRNLPTPGDLLWDLSPDGGEFTDALFLIEIPSDFQKLRVVDIELAGAWRRHTRQIFETAFTRGYLASDFIYLPGSTPRSFYVLSKGDVTLEGEQ